MTNQPQRPPVEIEAAETDPATSPLTCLAIGALIAAAPFYLVAMATAGELGQSDAAGNAMAAGFASLAELALWAALGLFVLLVCVQAKPPGEMIAAAVILAAGGAIASNLAITLMPQPGGTRITPDAMPVLVALYGAFVGFSGEASRRVRRVVTALFVAAALPLIYIPFQAQAQWQATAPERAAEQARLQAAQAREEARQRAQAEAEFEALGPDDRVDPFLDYLGGDSREDEAIARLRTVRTRQADTVRLMRGGTHIRYFDRLPEWGVEPDAEVCAAYRAMFEAKLAEAVPANAGWRGVPQEMSGSPASLRWLMANGCDLRAPVERLARLIRSLGDQYFESYPAELEAILREGVRTP